MWNSFVSLSHTHSLPPSLDCWLYWETKLTTMIAVNVICNVIRCIDGHIIPVLSLCHLDGSFNFSCGISIISNLNRFMWWKYEHKKAQKLSRFRAVRMEFETREIEQRKTHSLPLHSQKATKPNQMVFFDFVARVFLMKTYSIGKDIYKSTNLKWINPLHWISEMVLLSWTIALKLS